MTRQDVRIFVIDDEQGFCRLISDVLTGEGYAALPFTDARQALDAFRADPADLIVTDIKMPGMDGIRFMEALRELDPEVPVIVVTGFATTDIAIDALRLGAMNFLRKPFRTSELVAVVTKAVRVKKILRRKRDALERIEPRQSLEIAAELQLIEPTIHCLLESVRAIRRIPPRVELDIAAALSEALANAVLHGSRSDPAKKVRIAAEVGAHEALFRIRDEGPGFDHARSGEPPAAEPVAEPAGDSGRGLMLMRHYMDEVRHIGAGNVVELVKKLD